MAAAVGLTTGGAYVIGGFARAAVVHAQIERLASAAAHGYSETALEAAARDPGALALARAHDPYAAAGTPAADHEDRIAAFADELQARRENAAPSTDPAARLARISLTTPSPQSAPAPFRLRGVLEESRDLECLTQAVYYEARGENAAGQAAVAQVVLNRTRHPSFPKTICGVVFQGAAAGGCQFSFACDGSVHRRVEGYAWRRAEQVAARALDGFVMTEVGSATHFHVASLSTNWGPGLMRVAQIGAHVFYRFGGHGGPSPAFGGGLAPTPEAPAATPAPAQPVYASLSLAPLANSVASSVANSVAGAAEMVMAATQPKASPASKPAEPAAKPAMAPSQASPSSPAATTQSISAPVASKADEAVKTATIS